MTANCMLGGTWEVLVTMLNNLMMSWKQATFNPHRSGAKSTDWRLHVIFSACRVVNTIGVCVNDKCTVQERQRRVELLGMNQAILYIGWHVWTSIQKQVLHIHLVEHSRSIKFAKVRNFGFCPKVHFFVIRILFIAFYFSSLTSDFDYSNFLKLFLQAVYLFAWLWGRKVSMTKKTFCLS